VVAGVAFVAGTPHRPRLAGVLRGARERGGASAWRPCRVVGAGLERPPLDVAPVRSRSAVARRGHRRPPARHLAGSPIGLVLAIFPVAALHAHWQRSDRLRALHHSGGAVPVSGGCLPPRRRRGRTQAPAATSRRVAPDGVGIRRCGGRTVAHRHPTIRSAARAHRQSTDRRAVDSRSISRRRDDLRPRIAGRVHMDASDPALAARHRSMEFDEASGTSAHRATRRRRRI
jgi:hypothetical protein